MNKNVVFTKLNPQIEKAMCVKGLEEESLRVTDFVVHHGERFHYDGRKKRYFINSFYPNFPSTAWKRFITGAKRMVTENIRIPIQADVVVTGKCHCRCWHCFRIKDTREDLSLEEIKNVMHSLFEMGTATIGITGGEPMLRSDIRDIIRLIPTGIQGQLYTTGHNIDSDFARFISTSNVTRVIVSLDHYVPELANNMRHYKYAFSEAGRAIKHLVDEGVYTAVTVCITEALLEGTKLKSYFDYVSGLNPDEIRVILPIPQGKLEGHKVSRLYSDAICFIKKLKKQYENDEKYPGIINFCEFESAQYMGCSAGANYISINNDGQVTPCVAVPLSFGNIRDRSLKDIYADMEAFFPKSGRICYGKISGKVIAHSDIDTSITPLSESDSAKIASKCVKSKHRASIFTCFEKKGS